MPIRFVCEHCGQRLSVGTDKAGARAKCPKCKGPILVPTPKLIAAEHAQAAPDSEAAAPPVDDRTEADQQRDAEEGYQDPFAQFMVYDDTELVYASEEAEDFPAAEPGWIDPTKVAVPRYLLYMQGVLLGVVCLASFAMGVIVGRQSMGGRDPQQLGPSPCLISGRIEYLDDRRTQRPDEGAVAIVLPQDVRPEQRAEVSGLLPIDPLPDENHPGLQTIRSIGGDYARADENGDYQLRVGDTGKYFVLFISRHKRQVDTDRPKIELAQIGRFFNLGPEMFGGDAYRWREESVGRDRQLNERFE
jgi:DNA-directed RNA polymerase subunit RPC12/RpoP